MKTPAKTRVAAGVIVLLMLAGCGETINSNTDTNYGSSSFPKNTPQTSSVTYVYVTEHGEKYHQEDCQYVRGKDNLTEYTIEEAEELGYEPCSVCRPDK